ncbi:DUF1217 domain-containing protein [Acidimangrovimonas sediminis]|uniref:DUF1217 domain-containing protein n=1 Tax=Acidimangrovimonas sediminis TaxID=2056283 RepID=UPI000C80C180|nr:DUF1217 domain-containing protein [Acidimangrovimonas sediminis]
MTFQPVLPLTGYAGWKFLSRTMEAQQEAFNNSGTQGRDSDYFRENIAKVTTAEDLVSDYRLLKVALGAFGLDDDLPNKAFITRVLADGTLSSDALGNKLSDSRYASLARAFSFDLTPPNTQKSDFADTILSPYARKQFEIAVGEQDNNMRLAMALPEALGAIAEKSASETTKWFSVMGTTSIRTVFETALGLPSSFAALDLDLQLETLQDKSTAYFGDSSVSQFSAPEQMDKLVRLFMIRAGASGASGATTGTSAALQILQAGQGGSAGGILSILAAS